MIIKKTKIKDLLIVKQKNNIDKRGSLRETFNNKFLKKKFIFEYCTTSKKNVLRGFHFQTKFKQAKYVNVVKGKILDVVIDLRKNSKTFGKTFKIILSKKNALGLYIPAGFGHAYYSYDKENIIYYKLDNYYAPKYENGIIFNDSIFKIKWPKKIIVSEKDRKLLSFKNFIKKFKAI
ncbi:dTDP-4-dehydrorhamnose 3,5-epimerase [Pelagibacteraceae bacterium]|nr:dTDP-4-dehydrorhamnose 3,5-epimerase [Pelagibacteraceae bacterium]